MYGKFIMEVDVGRAGMRNHPISDWLSPPVERHPRRAAASAALKALAKLAFSSGPKNLPIAKWRPPDTKIEPLHAIFLMHLLVEPDQSGLSTHSTNMAAVADPAHAQLGGRHGNFLARLGTAEMTLNAQ